MNVPSLLKISSNTHAVSPPPHQSCSRAKFYIWCVFFQAIFIYETSGIDCCRNVHFPFLPLIKFLNFTWTHGFSGNDYTSQLLWQLNMTTWWRFGQWDVKVPDRAFSKEWECALPWTFPFCWWWSHGSFSILWHLKRGHVLRMEKSICQYWTVLFDLLLKSEINYWLI